MNNALTKEIAYKKLQGFFEDTPLVLFGSGMSCAVDHKFGMDALEKELKEKLENEKLTNSQKTEWNNVLEKLSNNTDFETSLNNVKDTSLLDTIVKIAGDFVATQDSKYLLQITKGSKNWPAVKLFKKLVDKLPGSDRVLHVATPNYDMLAEYAFENSGIPYINGFTGGVNRRLDWQQSVRSITYVEKIPFGKKIKPVTRERKHIRLYKVHGSLNFFIVNDKIIENNAWLHNPPNDNVKRLIITPGESKHKKLLKFRNELLKPFDDVVEKHNAFLFLGFGFNDSQLNTRDIFEKKLKAQNCNGLILTKDPKDRIEVLLKEAENLWLVCKHKDRDITLIKNKKYPKSLELENERLWQVDIFTQKILGG